MTLPRTTDRLNRRRARRLLPGLTDAALARRDPRGRRSAALVRRAADARLKRRLAASVVVFVEVREEQELLEQLAHLVEQPEPLSADHVAAVKRLVRESAPPSLSASLRELRRLLEAAPASRAENYPPET